MHAETENLPAENRLSADSGRRTVTETKRLLQCLRYSHVLHQFSDLEATSLHIRPYSHQLDVAALFIVVNKTA